MLKSIDIRFLGPKAQESEFNLIEKCSDGNFCVGKGDVRAIYQTKDKKVEFIYFDHHVIAFINSALGYPAYYPVEFIKIEKPIKAVLMDLDGTSVKSEEFWIWIIEQTTATLLGDKNFQLEDSDLPYVSGHSVSEHLQHCIQKYCPEKTVEEARTYYFEHTHREMKAIMDGHGRKNAFVPTEGLKDFLLELKSMDIKIGLVTSGLYEKAWPEILSAFKTIDMGDPKEFYDAVITAGFPMRVGEPGTLGELSPKPHPWLYSEIARIGLGIPKENRHNIIGIEDSGAGVSSIRLAGFSAIGIADGNIIESGTKSLCHDYCGNFEEIMRNIK